MSIHHSSINFLPDWSDSWTASDAEMNLPGFVFKGPGWYITKTDIILVVPYRRLSDLWNQKNQSENEVFTFYIYNERNPAEIFSLISNAPVRQDERENYRRD